MPTNVQLAKKLDEVMEKLAEKDEQISSLKKLVAPQEVMNEKIGAMKKQLQVKVSTYKPDYSDKPLLVTSWRTLVDDVHTMRGNIFENQEVEITLEDEQTVNLSLVDFTRLVKSEKVFIDMDKSKVREIVFENGEKRWDLIEATFIWNGEEHTLPNTFINNP